MDVGARKELEDGVSGRKILITNQHDWTRTEMAGAYRSQSRLADSFRQPKDRHVVSFSPMHHWTDDHFRVRTFTCILALQIAHLMTPPKGTAWVMRLKRKPD